MYKYSFYANQQAAIIIHLGKEAFATISTRTVSQKRVISNIEILVKNIIVSLKVCFEHIHTISENCISRVRLLQSLVAL